MSAWVTLVSLAGGGLAGGSLFSVREGNVRMCEGLLQASGASVYTSATIRAIIANQPADETAGSYVLTTADGAEEVYDAVILAAPLEFAQTEFRGVALPEAAQIQRPYQVTHATFVLGRLRPDFFNLPLGSPLPEVILTQEEESIPFSSIGALGSTSDGQRTAYKVFTREPADETLLEPLFTDVTEVEHVSWHAYPMLTPTSVWPPFELGPNLYYANAMESAVSTMETEAIAARNVVNLLVKGLAARS